MAISFNTGTTATLSSVAHTVNFTFTVPAGVNAGDVMIVSVETFTFTSAAPAVAAPSSGGGNWTQISTLQDAGPNAGLDGYATAWFRVATAADPGSTFTTHFTGPPSTDQFWWAAALGSYAGANTAGPIDVSGGIGQFNGAGTITCPSLATLTAGDWALYLMAAGLSSNAGATGPAGSTQRENVTSSADLAAALFDSNGPVGPAGTSIGGGTFAHAGSNWWGAFTVGLAPAPPAAAGGAPDRHHHRTPAGRPGQHRPGGRGGHR